jgi:hypothetical protein
MEAANTWNTALSIIKNKGYKVATVGENGELMFWRGVKGHKNIAASDPLSLLGLITIAEEYGEDWNRINTGELYDKIIEADIIKDIKLNMYHSLIGHIDKGVRAIAYAYYKNKIELYVYQDREPNESDYEIIDRAVTEMMSNDPTIKEQKIEITETHEPINKLHCYDGWIFCRYEHNKPRTV